MAQLINVSDYREQARKRLSRIAFDYLERGAEDEITLRRNREIFSRLIYNPRTLTGLGATDLSCTLFGRQYKLPLVIGPAGFMGLFWQRGDLVMASAAAQAGIPYVLPTLASSTVEEVARVQGGERWFQVYPFQDDGHTDEMIGRARDAGYTAIVLTVDTAVGGKREASMRHGAHVPMPITLRFLLDVLAHPRWTYKMLRHGPPRMANLETLRNGPRKGEPFSYDALFKRNASWHDVARLRNQWRGIFMLKGIQSAEDARLAREAGVDGIVLSNHGGRQLDGSPSAIEVLPEVLQAIGNDIPVMVDGGVQRGGDIVKAMALGASAVWLGRTPIYGLAVAGEAGVLAVLEILRQEMEISMALLGVDRLCQLQPHCLRS
jgi:(S)-mandelate dehydrogenase